MFSSVSIDLSYMEKVTRLNLDYGEDFRPSISTLVEDSSMSENMDTVHLKY